MSVVESSGFAVPLALDPRGRLVPPERAVPGETHRCPLCQAPLGLHAGSRKRRHFHHRTTAAGCASESVAHATAKQLVVAAVDAWRAGGDPPVFVRACAKAGCPRTVRQPMPRKVLRAETERRLASGRVVDVALLGPAGLLVAAIEVFRTHRVDEAKSMELGAPWVEVDALAVCRDEGRVLTALRDKLRPWLCAAHASARVAVGTADRERALRRASAVRALPFPLDGYPDYSIARIVRCERGHDAIVWTWKGKAAPSPRVPLVRVRENALDHVYSGAERRVRSVLPFRRILVSVCAVCGATLGAR